MCVFFFLIKECIKLQWPICSLFRTVSSFLILQNNNILSESFGKISRSVMDTMIASFYSFCQTRCIYLAAEGFRSEKGMRSPVGSLSRTSLAALSAASFPQIPTCPGTHKKQFPSEIHQFYVTYLGFVLAEDGLFSIFLAFAKQIVNLGKPRIYFL